MARNRFSYLGRRKVPKMGNRQLDLNKEIPHQDDQLISSALSLSLSLSLSLLSCLTLPLFPTSPRLQCSMCHYLCLISIQHCAGIRRLSFQLAKQPDLYVGLGKNLWKNLEFCLYHGSIALMLLSVNCSKE
jgi:hypothetical protein